MVNSCTSPACFLAGNGGLVSLPLITLAGLVDSLNPCAIAMIILLLTYLVIFGKRPERVLPTGLIYIGAVFLTYLLIGLVFYQTFSQIGQIEQIRFYLNKILGSLLILAAILNIKDFFLPSVGPHLEIPATTRPFLKKLTERVSYPAAAALGVLVTILETPCSLPIYVGTANILSQSGLGTLGVLGYFGYYNFLFILPLLIILLLVWQGSEWKIIELQDFQHRGKRWMKLALGVLLLGMGGWLVLW
ncbi:GAP family protein [Candidatus Gottesmanbacteria bacterium]|nr:GAP family protein [Candidatus Gottesmanbacteria bacterium]MBI5465507.1 GAP family protein [Candidatus Gottesmanbacteria bacterium]